MLCVDEMPQTQALDRTRASPPMKKGRARTMTHDYKQNRNTTLFAALSMLDGRVGGGCLPTPSPPAVPEVPRAQPRVPGELELHLIVDNYRTHKNDDVNV